MSRHSHMLEEESEGEAESQKVWWHSTQSKSVFVLQSRGEKWARWRWDSTQFRLWVIQLPPEALNRL